MGMYRELEGVVWYRGKDKKLKVLLKIRQIARKRTVVTLY